MYFNLMNVRLRNVEHLCNSDSKGAMYTLQKYYIGNPRIKKPEIQLLNYSRHQIRNNGIGIGQ